MQRRRKDRQLRSRGVGARGRQARRREDETDLLRPLRPCLSHHGRCSRQRILRREEPGSALTSGARFGRLPAVALLEAWPGVFANMGAS